MCVRTYVRMELDSVYGMCMYVCMCVCVRRCTPVCVSVCFEHLLVKLADCLPSLQDGGIGFVCSRH